MSLSQRHQQCWSWIAVCMAIACQCSQGCSSKQSNENGNVAAVASEHGNYLTLVTQRKIGKGSEVPSAVLPAEAKEILEKEIQKIFFVTPKRGLHATVKRGGNDWVVEGTADYLGDDIRLSLYDGLLMAGFGYIAAPIPILEAERLNEIDQGFDISFKASAAARIATELKEGRSSDQLLYRRVDRFRNVTTQVLDFPGCVLIHQKGKWLLSPKKGWDEFSSEGDDFRNRKIDWKGLE